MENRKTSYENSGCFHTEIQHVQENTSWRLPCFREAEENLEQLRWLRSEDHIEVSLANKEREMCSRDNLLSGW